MNRQQLQKRLETAWTALQVSYTDLSDSQLIAAGVTDDWSIKDILAHITIWEEEALKHLPVLIDGGRPPRYSVTYGGIDAFNDQMIAQRRDLSLADVMQHLDTTHQRLVEFIETIPDEHITRETRVRRRLRLDTYSHYPLHTKAIHAWRERQA